MFMSSAVVVSQPYALQNGASVRWPAACRLHAPLDNESIERVTHTHNSQQREFSQARQKPVNFKVGGPSDDTHRVL